MAKKISGAEYPLAKIFSSEFEYLIPSYQRPYAWTTDQASELFDDLYDFFKNEGDEGYFLGSIVLIKEDAAPKSEVIDGQQRLTTLTIFLAALTSFMTGGDRDTLYRYIVEPGNRFEGLAPKPRLTLRERDRDFFTKYVQELKFDELDALGAQSLENESRKNIQLNSRLLLNRIKKNFAGSEDRLQDFIAFLLQRCFLVAVSTPNQQSAFRVFSVMNSRGLDLQPTDIIKADVIGKMRSPRDQDSYNDRWEDMEVELGRSGFNDLFAYIRMIYVKKKATRSLLEDFREHVIPRASTTQLLIETVLEPFAEALATLKGSNYMSDSDANKINGYLRWLNRIDNSDWLPPAILFFSRHKNNSEYVLWFFQRLERLAAYMHVCARNVNERIERYAELISALENSNDQAHPVQKVELTDIEKTALRRALDGDIYQLTPRRRNYLILRLDSFISDGAATYDASVLTIEHVLPQTIPSGSDWVVNWPDPAIRENWVHRIANLVPLNKRRNSQAQNYAFDKKKSAYFSGSNNVSSYALTSQVINETSWTPTVVQNRQSDLLKIFVDNWSL